MVERATWTATSRSILVIWQYVDVNDTLPSVLDLDTSFL